MKTLIVASVPSFIEWFNRENIDYLLDRGDEVHIAVNAGYHDDCDPLRVRTYFSQLVSKGVKIHDVSFHRGPFAWANVKAYRHLNKIINSERFDLIHCHTPVASVLTRLAARKMRNSHGTMVLYSCHGFQFHRGSQFTDWLYYPIERMMSRFCDCLITINHEDYERAKRFCHCDVCYIPGVGVDFDRFQIEDTQSADYRKELGIPTDAIVVLSVGELDKNKNHSVIIKSIAQIKSPNIYYVIAGKGVLYDKLQSLAEELDVKERVRLLGFRNDIPRLCKMADIGAFPSIREGLGIAGLELQASGLPLISSNVQGIVDYNINDKTGICLKPHDVEGFAKAIEKLAIDPALRTEMGNNARESARRFSKVTAIPQMWKIYDDLTCRKL